MIHLSKIFKSIPTIANTLIKINKHIDWEAVKKLPGMQQAQDKIKNAIHKYDSNFWIHTTVVTTPIDIKVKIIDGQSIYINHYINPKQLQTAIDKIIKSQNR